MLFSLKRSVILSLVVICGWSTASSQLSYITFVHNSPDPAMRTLDLYIIQSGVETKIENIDYQSGKNLNSEVIIFGDIEVTYKVAPGSSGGSGDAVYTATFTPEAFAGYLAVFEGVSNVGGYVANPDGVSLNYNIRTFEVAASVTDPSKLGAVFSHGTPDLERSDVYLRGASTSITSGLKFRDQVATPAELVRSKVTIDFTKAGDKSKVLASFAVDFSALASQVVVFISSGFKTPGDNDDSSDSLALLAVLEDGRVVRYPVLSGSQTARVQVVHNSPDPTLQVVDIWINGTRSNDNLGFRKAGGFQQLAAGSPIVVWIATATSTGVKDTVKSITIDPLRPGRSYHFIIHGVTDTSKFAKNPTGRDHSLSVAVIEGALEKAISSGLTSVRTALFVSDLSAVTVASRSSTYLSKGGYGDFSPEYVEVTPQSDTLWVRDGATDTVITGFVANLSGTDRAVLALLSGFVATDATNQGGPKRTLILVNSNGNVESNLVEVALDTTTSSVDEDLVPATLWTVGPNPSTDHFNISIPLTHELLANHGGILSAHVFTQHGINLGIYPMNIMGLNAVANIPTSRMANGTYMVYVTTASGKPVGSANVAVVR